MLSVKIPPTGDLVQVTLPDDYNFDDVFPDSIPEHVRFPIPGTAHMFEWKPDHLAEKWWVVMLVDENFLINGLDHNERASNLSGRIILGDAYLVLEHRSPMEGDEWRSLEDPYDMPDFWNTVLADG